METYLAYNFTLKKVLQKLCNDSCTLNLPQIVAPPRAARYAKVLFIPLGEINFHSGINMYLQLYSKQDDKYKIYGLIVLNSVSLF